MNKSQADLFCAPDEVLVEELKRRSSSIMVILVQGKQIKSFAHGDKAELANAMRLAAGET